ncbi:hypothetical protein QUB80_17545 [Chlorogloeopsis sp. ULAP01]|uniref:hypothetical protein n=1 Tax=Chlorogloeopsis sp. ULAP01 TaxID=3056483 RepID=UPI0025AA8792|nr:hypothetical protein [Chlorogloeopsis sp. ULAP01]MDM9382507.1 hypothetical protein [Chlorogloeopsis sp. ULAP01]
MAKPTVRVLFKAPEDGTDRKEALIWAKPYQDNWLQALQECARGDWLIWMMTRLRAKPKPLISITYQCILLAISELDAWGDMPFRRGLYTVERWLNGEATPEDSQDAFDDLSCDNDMEPLDAIALANEIVSYLLNACVDVSEQSLRSDLACDLAWAIYTAAKLQERWGNVESLKQILLSYANFIRKSPEYENLLNFN